MIKFWLDQTTCFYQDPVIDKYYPAFYIPFPLNEISNNGTIDLSSAIWGFDDMHIPRDVKITIYVLNRGFKI